MVGTPTSDGAVSTHAARVVVASGDTLERTRRRGGLPDVVGTPTADGAIGGPQYDSHQRRGMERVDVGCRCFVGGGVTRWGLGVDRDLWFAFGSGTGR